MTNSDKIISALTNSGARCDDCLSADSEVKPRQSVNQECRLLENRGKLTRQRQACPLCGGWKIVNRLTE